LRKQAPSEAVKEKNGEGFGETSGKGSEKTKKKNVTRLEKRDLFSGWRCIQTGTAFMWEKKGAE